jgi:DNA polymerase III alpha subunit (gram-positive type)
MKLLFADTETTGLKPLECDVIQVGAVVMDNRKVLAEVDLKCQPVNWDAISPYALKVNNNTIESLKKLEDPKLAWKKFYTFINAHFNGEKYILGGQNIKFDRAFLNAWWDKHKDPDAPEFESYFEEDALELMHITKTMKKHGLLDVENVKLGTIVEALNIKVDGNLHDALTDIKATVNSTYKLLIQIKKLKAESKASIVVKQFDEWLQILG